MKKSLILSLTVFFLLAQPSYALTATSSAATPAATIDQKAQDLLNRVATKVAQLSEKLQKSYWGRIKTLGTSTFVIVTENGEKAVNTNDATSFFRIRSGNRTEINFTGLKIGDDIAAIGTIDPITSDLSARQVIAKIKRENFVGEIKTVEKTVVTLTRPDQTEVKLDLDGAPLKMASTSGKISTAKLADLSVGDFLSAIAYSPDEKTGIFSVLKALILP